MPRPRAVVIGATAIVLGAFALATTLGSEFLPSLDEGVIWIRANLPPGISLVESSSLASEMRKIVLQFPRSSSLDRRRDETIPAPIPSAPTATSF